MTQEEIQLIQSTVQETLLSLGIDVKDQIRTQSQMMALRELAKALEDEEFKADLIHVRRWRKSMEKVSDLSVKTAVGIIVTGLCGMLVFGVKNFLGKP